MRRGKAIGKSVVGHTVLFDHRQCRFPVRALTWFLHLFSADPSVENIFEHLMTVSALMTFIVDIN